MAQSFLLTVMLAALGAVAAATVLDTHGHASLSLLAITVALCAGSAVFEVLAPGNLSLQVNLVFFTWGAVLLPPWTIGVLAVASFLPTAIVHRSRWYVAGFNIANYALAGIAAHVVMDAIAPLQGHEVTAATVVALIAAAATLVAVNHLLIVGVVHFAHGRPLRIALSDSIGALSLDAALALSGAVLAAMWGEQELLALLAVGPLLLMYRALYVPMLRHKARLDPKTGLYNFEHFEVVLRHSVRESERTGEPVGVLMLDLDHLRAVNNRFGHLAGDRLIRGVAETLTTVLRPTDHAARFGGEEFCVVLPGANAQQAVAIAERIRHRMAESSWNFSEGEVPLRATVSIGVAVTPEHGTDPEGILHAADAAVYDAKLGGRNRVRLAHSGAMTQTVPVGLESLDLDLDAQRALNGTTNGHATAPSIVDALVAERPRIEEPEVAEDKPETKPRRAMWVLVGLLVAGTIAVASVSSTDQIAAQPGIFVALVLSVLLLDIVRLDVFERGNVSPAAVPSIALAMLFGPLGPIIAEGTIALSRAVRRTPTRVWLADFGMLSLTGAAIAGLWMALSPETHAAVIAASVVMGITSYAVNAGLLMALIAVSKHVNPFAAFREGWAWLFVHYIAFGVMAGGLYLAVDALGVYGLVPFAIPIVMLWMGERQYLNRSRSSVQELRTKHDELERANRSLRALVDEKQALLSRMHRSYLSTITSLARTIEAKDPYTGGHTERVARIACLLAEEMGFAPEDVRAVNVGAVIHDIGKIGVPDNVLLKPGQLAPDELAHIRRHPEISSYILADLDLPAIVKQMVRSHHERYDGGGYPDNLTGEEIPLAARILTVADALDAMTSDRPYRHARPLHEALDEITARSGEQFCPRVVAALHACLRHEPSLSNEIFGGAEALI